MSFFCIHCRAEIDPKFKACPHCGEPITDFLRRHLHQPIDGKYQILARLGVGGMGEVYKVLHIHLNAVRVVKLMRPAIATDASAHDRFLREARLATKIHHPNVATLFDFSTLSDGSFYMVWEYIEGTNLHELIEERGPLSPKYASLLAMQALHGLDAIHRAGIVHRDVSPENLMITRDDEGNERVKIIDLGIAKGSEDDQKTKTGMFVGKWKYCSPEHLGMLPDGERIDGRADLYSFGIVLYEMLTGVPPFQADTPHKYLMLHASERPRKLREVNPTVAAAPALEAIIFRALEKDRTQRFATAREMAQAIERILPILSDKAGAEVIPPAVEVQTDEATRVRETPQLAETVRTDAATVMTNVRERPSAPPPRRRSPVIAILVILGALAVIYVALRRKEEPAAPPKPVAAAAVPLAAAHLAINAFPWANVTRIQNTDSGESIELKAPMVTPASPIDLAPGRYRITCTNPSFRGEVVETVELKPGEEKTLNVRFVNPEQAQLPELAP